MQSLPTELQVEILRYLPEKALSTLSTTCRHNYHLTKPLLYEKLAITIRLETPPRSPLLKIKSLAINNWDRCKYLRSVTVTCREPEAWMLKGQDILISLHLLLIHLPPSGLTSFAWEVECPFEPDILRYLPRDLRVLDTNASLMDFSRPFDQMVDLRCRQLSFKTAKHLMHQLLHIGLHLQRLCISLESSLTSILSPSLVEALSQATDNNFLSGRLTYLELQNIYIQRWPFRNTASIETLSLQRCLNVDVALAGFIAQRPDFAHLRKLRIFLCSESKSISIFFRYLQQNAKIEELQFFVQGYNCSTLDWIIPFSRTLGHLVLESRQLWSEPTSVNPYKFEDFLALISKCTSLKFLGIPVLIEKTLRVKILKVRDDFC